MKEITVQELKKRLADKSAKNVLDVRETWEYEEFNIGAKNIPLSIFLTQLEELEDLKNEEVIVHCKMGGRSMQAAAILEQAGFANVVNVLGGMDAWRMAFGPPLPNPPAK